MGKTGMYLNPGDQGFRDAAASDIYVDKTGLIEYTNSRIGKNRPYICSSRPRRFGKTMAAQMLAAYYCKECDSREIFDGLKISSADSYKEHINRYNVILLDMQWLRSVAKRNKKNNYIDFAETEAVNELRCEYPDCVKKNERSLASALAAVNKELGIRFIIIIDEWDCVFREDKNDSGLQEEYITFLRSLFKGSVADRFTALAYITGILPIKKYGTQSALNIFDEFTMTDPEPVSEYIGFTESEVKSLCDKYGMSFDDMRKWYDGYYFRNTGHIYSPNSVINAFAKRKPGNFWTQTETYESLRVYIDMDFDGLKQKIVDMLSGKRCAVDINTFMNDMTTFNSSDDILTLLIHLGYLAYDSESKDVFIPNEEIRSEFVRAVKAGGWEEIYTNQRSEDRG